jgi:hypothetical protein
VVAVATSRVWSIRGAMSIFSLSRSNLLMPGSGLV